MSEEIIQQIRELTQQLIQLETAEFDFVCVNDNVSNPPTDAQLDTAFGIAANLYDGFTGLVDDAGAGTTVWLCIVKNSKWWYEQLTAAV